MSFSFWFFSVQPRKTKKIDFFLHSQHLTGRYHRDLRSDIPMDNTNGLHHHQQYQHQQHDHHAHDTMGNRSLSVDTSAAHDDIDMMGLPMDMRVSAKRGDLDSKEY
jgi:hypothetical protein